MKKTLLTCLAIVAVFAVFANSASAVTCTIDQRPAVVVRTTSYSSWSTTQPPRRDISASLTRV